MYGEISAGIWIVAINVFHESSCDRCALKSKEVLFKKNSGYQKPIKELSRNSETIGKDATVIKPSNKKWMHLWMSIYVFAF